ncbi:hypothetical protein [Ornithinimicrobium murale]|uniref:hypothetical protein n=1 Tax=Ornithinimicrobium murale TaxID=1050153 RepID=UPI000E0CCACE|nr:hypothetical protein [Ornithinimicrobium murale]
MLYTLSQNGTSSGHSHPAGLPSRTCPLPPKHAQIIPDLVDIPARVDAALDTLCATGMRPVLVGGSVRDVLLDPDLEAKSRCTALTRDAQDERLEGRAVVLPMDDVPPLPGCETQQSLTARRTAPIVQGD